MVRALKLNQTSKAATISVSRFFSCLLLSSVISPISSHANEAKLYVNNNWQWSLSAGLAFNNLSFEETNQTTTFNQESGNGLDKQFKLTLTNQQHYIRAIYIHHNSLLDYQGISQQGRKVTTETDYTNHRLALFYDYDITPLFITRANNAAGVQNHQLLIITGIEYDHSQRNILSKNNILGLNESYQIWNANLGLAWHYKPNDTVNFTLRSYYQHSISGNLDVDFLTTYDDAHLALDTVSGFRIELLAETLVNHSLSLTPYVMYSQNRLEESYGGVLTIEGEKVGKFHQPQRDKQSLQLGLSLNYFFN